MTLRVRPKRGGFLRPFGCAWFIREFLLGNGPYGSPVINQAVGAPQSDIFHYYKMGLIQETAVDRATHREEKLARRERRPIDPSNITLLTQRYLVRLPYKAHGCRYHSFVTYFAMLTRLGWVEPSGKVEPSSFQASFPAGQPRIYYRLTDAGRGASDIDWSNPQGALYGRR
jgi:hypothetical protein